MTESDDPWANHIRGMAPTPLEEGKDPLSSPFKDPPTQSTPLSSSKIGKSRNFTNRIESESLEASWDRERNDTGDSGKESRSSPSNDVELISPDSVSDLTDMSKTKIEEESEDVNEDEQFVYPGQQSEKKKAADSNVSPTIKYSGSRRAELGKAPEQPSIQGEIRSMSTNMEREQLVGSSSMESQPTRPIDHNRLSNLCSQGPLSSLQSFFKVTTSPPPAGSGISSFALANEPNPTSGLVPIHYAAREGKVEILKWLVKEVGALIEMEDREGETALHKSSLAGKLPALTFLLSARAEANNKDGDGWTALHNACSRGYLDIVKVLVENAGAEIDVKGGRGGWTPLMNASSHGHLPIVRYLTSKQHADPFVRNAAGETAYDVAAATFEIYICEVLERYESERWAALSLALGNSTRLARDSQDRKIIPGQGPYNPLALHTTIPIVLHENQRLDTRLSTLAIRGGKPRWSGTQAGSPDKTDRRAPGTIPPGPLSLSRSRNIPMKRDDVQLPTRKEPYKIRLTNRSVQIAAAKRSRGEGQSDDLGSTPTPESVMINRNGNQIITDQNDLSHFWLSDWQTDLTHPLVDAEQGWQYSTSFDTPEERWISTPPPLLARLLEGRGLSQSVQRAVTGVVLATSGNVTEMDTTESTRLDWVRRRRWVRVMRRRLDIEFNDELEFAEQASLILTSSSSQHDGRGGGYLTSASIIEAQQEAMSDAEALGSNADYVARSKIMAGRVSQLDQQNEEAVKRQIARLQIAISELRNFAFTDEDATRQARAEELLKEYTVQLSRLRQSEGLEEESEDEDEDDEEFIYPNSYKDDGQSVITRIGITPSITTNGIVPPRQRSTPSEAGTSVAAARSADLANAREFRVPTNEVPNRTGQGFRHNSLQEQNLLPIWENDSDVNQCRGCNRKFTFFLRKHHCRKCGRIYCDNCSSHRAHLSPSELVIDSGIPEMMLLESSGPTRICDSCDAESRLPNSLQNLRGTEVLSGVIDRLDLTTSDESGISDISSRASELNECPVCGLVLAGLGEGALQEEHIRDCLENGGGGSVQGSRYLIYKLAEGPIVGKECQICLEDLCIGMTIARLPCLCYYHRHCIDSWFSRGRSCPVHARSW